MHEIADPCEPLVWLILAAHMTRTYLLFFPLRFDAPVTAGKAKPRWTLSFWTSICELAERISQALKDEAELNAAISRLMK